MVMHFSLEGRLFDVSLWTSTMVPLILAFLGIHLSEFLEKFCTAIALLLLIYQYNFVKGCEKCGTGNKIHKDVANDKGCWGFSKLLTMFFPKKKKGSSR